jgi:hypothetical protein
MTSPALRARTLTMLLLLVAGALTACVPTTVAEQLAGPAAQEVERTADETFHRMELGRIRTGAYTTNVLVDVALPRGTRITVEAFSGDDYRLRIDADAIDGVVWLVSPRGVRRVIAR